MNTLVTAYCACSLCCGPMAHGKTTSGATPQQGRTIAASRAIPFGTKVAINGHIYVVEDRLARKYDNRVDIYFAQHKDAVRFGKKRLTVKILRK